MNTNLKKLKKKRHKFENNSNTLLLHNLNLPNMSSDNSIIGHSDDNVPDITNMGMLDFGDDVVINGHSDDDVPDITNMGMLDFGDDDEIDGGDDIDILGNVDDDIFVNDALPQQQIAVGNNNAVNDALPQRQIAIGAHDWPYYLHPDSESQIDLSDLQTSAPMPQPPPLDHNLHSMQSSSVN